MVLGPAAPRAAIVPLVGDRVRELLRCELPIQLAPMGFYAGQSAGAVDGILPAAEIVAELARGLP